MPLNEYAFSMQMRDTIAKMVREEIDKQRPRYRYGVVESIDRAGRKCAVVLNGETGSVTVNTGHVQPSRIGDVVRVEGIGTDKFVTDVMSIEAYIGRIRGGSGDVDHLNLGLDGNHPFQAGYSDAVNLRWDNNEMWAVDNGVLTSYAMNGDFRLPQPQGVHITSMTRKDYVDSQVGSIIKSTTPTPSTGWALWNDNIYKNLFFLITRDNIVHVSGVVKFSSGTSLKICSLTGDYVPWPIASATDGPRHILGGNVNNVPRPVAVYSDGLYLVGALPTANQYVSVNGWYPGLNFVP